MTPDTIKTSPLSQAVLRHAAPSLQLRGRFANDPEECLEGEINDLDAVSRYLLSPHLARSIHTTRAYTKELRRLCYWCYGVREKTLSDMSPDDVDHFYRWLVTPPHDQTQVWGRKLFKRRRVTTENGATEFRTGLDERSAATAMTIIAAFFQWMEDIKYVKVNVMRVKRNLKRAPRKPKQSHGLSQEAIEAIKTYVRQMPNNDENEIRRKARAQMLMLWGFNLGFRRFELSRLRVGQIQRNTRTGKYLWVGKRKGGKEVSHPIQQRVAEQLIEYLNVMGLPLRFGRADGLKWPVFPHIASNGRPLGDQAIYNEIVMIFRGAAGLARLSADENHGEAAEELSQATPHWLRHTMIEAGDAAGLTGTEKRDLADHENEATTQGYQRTKENALSEAAERVVVF